MMRPLRPSITIASAVVLMAACDDGTRAESAASQARESSLAGDLALAGDSALAKQMATRGRVSESPGMLDASAESEGTGTGTLVRARNASNVVSAPMPTAEGYIGPSCASPARDDQERCLLGYLAKSDIQLDRSYQSLIDRLKSEERVKGKSEPATVQRLRTAQRAWLVYRDDECRKRTIEREGPLWAPVRAQCLAAYSALRSRELDDALSKRKPVATRQQPTKSKRSTAKKATRHRTTHRR